MADELPAEQRLFPFLYVEEVRAYADFLVRAFAFVERVYQEDPADPDHVHAQLSLGGAVVMVGHAAAKWGTVSPRALPGVPSGVYAYVDGVDAHCARARAAGATIETEPEDRPWGDRMYTARDPEGHTWYFATRGRA